MVKVTGNFEIDEKSCRATISVNPKIYPLDVVLNAAYIFTENYYILLDGDPNDEIIVEIRPKKEGQDIKRAARDFNNELISYANYAVQELRNRGIREAILNRVLMTHSDPCCSPSYTAEPAYTAEPVVPWDEKEGAAAEESWDFDDPEGIAVPWEEKYGKGKD